MRKGLVSVIIPTYKRNNMLSRAIDSVLNQTYKEVEILVVDDNEPGDEYFIKNAELLERYTKSPQSKVMHIIQEHHTNGAIARNFGINKAKGEYVAFLDDDDVWLPQKIEKQVEYLNSHPECGAVSCLVEFYSNNNLLNRSKPYRSDNLQLNVLLRIVDIATTTFCGRLEVVLKTRLFDPNLKRCQDLQFFTDFLNVSTIKPINEVLVYMYADSTINRPNTEKLIEYKNQYFNSISSTIMSYDSSVRKRIRNAHFFEIIYFSIKEKKINVALKYFIKIGFNIKSYRDLFIRYKNR